MLKNFMCERERESFFLMFNKRFSEGWAVGFWKWWFPSKLCECFCIFYTYQAITEKLKSSNSQYFLFLKKIAHRQYSIMRCFNNDALFNPHHCCISLCVQLISLNAFHFLCLFQAPYGDNQVFRLQYILGITCNFPSQLSYDIRIAR